MNVYRGTACRPSLSLSLSLSHTHTHMLSLPISLFFTLSLSLLIFLFPSLAFSSHAPSHTCSLMAPHPTDPSINNSHALQCFSSCKCIPSRMNRLGAATLQIWPYQLKVLVCHYCVWECFNMAPWCPEPLFTNGFELQISLQMDAPSYSMVQ